MWKPTSDITGGWAVYLHYSKSAVSVLRVFPQIFIVVFGTAEDNFKIFLCR